MPTAIPTTLPTGSSAGVSEFDVGVGVGKYSEELEEVVLYHLLDHVHWMKPDSTLSLPMYYLSLQMYYSSIPLWRRSKEQSKM